MTSTNTIIRLNTRNPDVALLYPVQLKRLESNARMLLFFIDLQAEESVLVDNQLDLTASKVTRTLLVAGPRTHLTVNRGQISSWGTLDGYTAAFDGVRMEGNFRYAGGFSSEPLNIVNGLTLNGSLTGTGLDPYSPASGPLALYNDAAIQGTATLTNVAISVGSGQPSPFPKNPRIVFGPSVTIRGHIGVFIVGDGTVVINQGQIIADQGLHVSSAGNYNSSITLAPSDPRVVELQTLINEGTIECRNGDRLRILGSLDSPLVNHGTLRATGGALLNLNCDLVSSRTTCDAGAYCQFIRGRLLTESGAVSALSGPGTWLAAKPAFVGGTVRMADGAVLEGNPVLNNVTFEGELHNYDFDRAREAVLPAYITAYSTTIEVHGNLTVNGLIAFHSQPNHIGGGLVWQTTGPQWLDGRGTIHFEKPSYFHRLTAPASAEAALNIGPQITIQGSGYILGPPPGQFVIPPRINNFGSIIIDQPGAANWFRSFLSNLGTIQVGSQVIVTNEYNFTQAAQGRLVFHAAGTQPGVSHGQFMSTEPVILDGAVVLRPEGQWQPGASDVFDLMTFPSRTGTFSQLQGPPPPPALTWTGQYDPTRFRFRLGPSDPGGGDGGGGGGNGDPRGALHLDGTDDYALVAHSDVLNPYPMTLTAWFRTDRAADDVDGILSKYDDGSADGYCIFTYQGRVRARYFRQPGAIFIWDGGLGLDGGFVADGQWHHVTFVVDRFGGVRYVDGVQKADRGWNNSFRFDNGLGGPTTSTVPLQFGRFDQYPTSLRGDLDEVTLWNGALTLEEIILHKSRRVRVVDDPRLIGIWHFDEKMGVHSLDSTTNANHVLLLNGASWGISPVP